MVLSRKCGAGGVLWGEGMTSRGKGDFGARIMTQREEERADNLFYLRRVTTECMTNVPLY